MKVVDVIWAGRRMTLLCGVILAGADQILGGLQAG